MLNYAVDSSLLEPFVPPGTSVDGYQGQAYVSVVGFLFEKVRLKGVPVPFHRDFEEVNLRFYVRCYSGGEWRRGVVFIREMVPKPMIAWVARLLYNEQYHALPMRHSLEPPGQHPPSRVGYGWRVDGQWHGFRIAVEGEPEASPPGSLTEFITEHYWGYARQKDGGCLEYRVSHPRWRVWSGASLDLEGDPWSVYDPAFRPALSRPPQSIFLAEGSDVTVYKGIRI